MEADLKCVVSQHNRCLDAVFFSLQTKNRHMYNFLVEMRDSLDSELESFNTQSPDHSL